MRLLGYEIENHQNAKGRDCGFEIRCISDDLLTKYSQRSRQRDEAVSWFTAKNGRPPTDNEIAVLVRNSEVILLKRTFVLPWSQFLYAEGGNDEVRVTFTTHDILVTRSHPGSLMADLSTQRVSLLREPLRAERFGSDIGPQIISFSVRKVE